MRDSRTAQDPTSDPSEAADAAEAILGPMRGMRPSAPTPSGRRRLSNHRRPTPPALRRAPAPFVPPRAALLGAGGEPRARPRADAPGDCPRYAAPLRPPCGGLRPPLCAEGALLGAGGEPRTRPPRPAVALPALGRVPPAPRRSVHADDGSPPSRASPPRRAQPPHSPCGRMNSLRDSRRLRPSDPPPPSVSLLWTPPFPASRLPSQSGRE